MSRHPVRLLLTISLLLCLAVSASAAAAVTPANGTYEGRSSKGEWISFKVEDGYIHNFYINVRRGPQGHPDLLSARIEHGSFLGYSGSVAYQATWCDSHHLAGLRDARSLGDSATVPWHGHLEGAEATNPCPKETPRSPHTGVVSPGGGSWSGHSKNGVDVVFTVDGGNVLNLEFGPLRVFRETPLSGGTFSWDSRRGRVVTGRFCDANHMAGLITDTKQGERFHINFSAHRHGHGRPGESPCPPVPTG